VWVDHIKRVEPLREYSANVPDVLQVLLFVPVIYVLIGFQMVWDKALYYAAMFLASISFYTIFGQFMVYVTPSQQIAQVWSHSRINWAPFQTG